MDAFSVSLANGLNESKMKAGRMCAIAGVFGGFQFLMPLIGWFCVTRIAEAFETFHSLREREHPYYRIGVGNYNVFYVVIGDVMEVRRLLYSGRDWHRML